VRDRNLNEGNADQRIDAGFRHLNSLSNRLERAFETRVEDLREADRELLLLAERRLISSVSPTIGDRVEFALAKDRYEHACRAAAFLGCH
jgi:hypothetical protein